MRSSARGNFNPNSSVAPHLGNSTQEHRKTVLGCHRLFFAKIGADTGCPCGRRSGASSPSGFPPLLDGDSWALREVPEGADRSAAAPEAKVRDVYY